MIHNEIQQQKNLPVYKPWQWTDLDRLTPAQVKMFCAMAHWGGNVDLPYKSSYVSITPGRRFKTARKMVYLEIWVGQNAYDAYVDLDIFQGLLDKNEFTQDLSTLDGRTLSFACDYLLKPIIRHFGQKLSNEFSVFDACLTTSVPPEDGLWLGVRNLVETEAGFVILLPEEVVEIMADTLTRNRPEKIPQPKCATLSHSVSYRAGSVRLSYDEKEQLQQGDGIMLPDDWVPTKIEKVFVGSDQFFPTSSLDNALKVTGSITPIEHHTSQDKDMKHDPNMEIEISVEVARGRFTAAEFESIFKEAVLPFPTTISSRVTLICQEEVIATGELVDIEGIFGVRIDKVI